MASRPHDNDDRDPIADGHLPLDADRFLRQLVGSIAATLEESIRDEPARGFLTIVAARLGDQVDAQYRDLLSKDHLSRPEFARVLVDIKRRIGGDFYVREQYDDRILLGNRACPFGRDVLGRPLLCMMTSNVFGRVTAENLGYARVEIEKAIARGDSGCRVVVHLKRQDADASDTVQEYFGVRGA